MTRTNRIALIAAAAVLGMAGAVAEAHGPGYGMGYGMGNGGGYGPGGGCGMMGRGGWADTAGESCPGPGAWGRGGGAALQLFTTEERTAFRDQMRSAATPDERRKLADAQRVEVQKRAADKGVTLPCFN